MDSDGTVAVEVPTVERIVGLAQGLSKGERERLIEELKWQQMGIEVPRNPKGFGGIWRARFAEDIDLEHCLQKIRDESKRELEEIA